MLSKAFLTPKAGVQLGLLAVVVLAVVSTVGFMLIEGWPLGESFFMSVITISTVGYGEVRPLSTGGRLFATFVIFSGLGIAAYTSAKLGQMILEGELFGELGRRRMQREIDKLENHFIVCGFGRVGKPVAEGLSRAGEGLCIIDASSENEEEFGAAHLLYLIGDATDEEILRAAGVERARTVLALLPSDPDNLYLTITAKGLNRRATVIARANDQKAELKLKRGGADKVVSPYEIAGSRVLQAALKPTVVEVMELATHREHLDLSMEEVLVSEASPLNGPSIAKAGIRNEYGVIIVAIKRGNGDMIFNPAADSRIQSRDTLVTLGPKDALLRVLQAWRGE